MSILIKGMEMPDRRTAELMRTELACVSRECDRHCENCDLVQDRDELIAAFHEAIRVLEAVANAAQLPGGYGRLIDADAISESLAESATFRYNKRTFVTWAEAFESMIDMIADAPTIIEAERGAG